MKIELFLPFPPSINQYYAKTRNGLFISSKGRAWQAEVFTAVNEQCAGLQAIAYPVHLSAVLFMPDKRKRDLDNYLKPLLDSLVRSGVLADDSLVDQLFIYRGEQQQSGSVLLRIKAAAPVIERDALHLIG